MFFSCIGPLATICHARTWSQARRAHYRNRFMQETGLKPEHWRGVSAVFAPNAAPALVFD